MNINNFLKNISQFLWSDELEKLESYKRDLDYYKNQLNKKEWSNPEKWSSYNPEYSTIDNLKVPPNTFLTINDRDIKQWLIKNKIHLLPLNELVWKLEKLIFNYLIYKKDTNTSGEEIETWNTASYIFKSMADDCDGHAILFQTCMHILGYGNISIVKTGWCKLNTFEGGHAYNKVFVDNEWIIVDPTNPKEFRKPDWKYDGTKGGLGWFFNYWNIYK